MPENVAKRSTVTGKLCENMTYSAREAFKRLRTNVLLALSQEDSEKKCRVIGVSSAQMSEGKSTVSINLAYSLAELGKTVLLIDGDMRRPSIHDKLGCRLSPGLSEILLGTANPNKSVLRYQSGADATYFGVIPAGEIPSDPAELLNSGRFQELLEMVSATCDYVIVDLPPVNAVVDAVDVAGATDGMILVIRENHCPRFLLDECVEQLRYAKTRILGFVVNGCVEGSGKKYQYSQQGYYARYARYEK